MILKELIKKRYILKVIKTKTIKTILFSGENCWIAYSLHRFDETGCNQAKGRKNTSKVDRDLLMYIFQPEYLAQHSATGLKSQKRGLPTEIIQPIRGMLKSLFLSSKFNISIKFHSFQYIFFSIFWQNFCRRILK